MGENGFADRVKDCLKQQEQAYKMVYWMSCCLQQGI